jgi:hypothetical protein
MRGERYRVIKPFSDADGDDHPVGEEWLFIGIKFSKFDDELMICIQLSSQDEAIIPLIWREDGQQEVIER